MEPKPTLQIWFAKIKNVHEGVGFSRKIKIYALLEKNALKQAKTFCCPGEVLEYLEDSSGKKVWESEK